MVFILTYIVKNEFDATTPIAGDWRMGEGHGEIPHSGYTPLLNI